jgi:mono/diheme cytochrome c family protein
MRRLIIPAVALLLFYCSFSDSEVRLGRGMKLFATHCSECHGARGVGQDPGHPEGLWPDDGGTRLAPALNEKGHAWMYPPELIFQKVKVGLIDETSGMPSYAESLSDREIEMLIQYMTVLWPEEARNSYLEKQTRSRTATEL